MNHVTLVCLFLGLSGCRAISTTPLHDTARSLSMDYDQSLESALDAGQFYWRNSDITNESFGIAAHENGTQLITVSVFTYGGWVSSSDAEDAMRLSGYRPATLRELVAYSKRFPSEWTTCFVSIGSFPKEGQVRVAAYVLGSKQKRNLNLRLYDNIWSVDSSFLAVKL